MARKPPKESFEKFTGHIFLKHLKKNTESLGEYATAQKDRNYLFWQRDPLAILITDRKMAGEKLDIDFHQQNFYETGEDEFKILTHYMDNYDSGTSGEDTGQESGRR